MTRAGVATGADWVVCDGEPHDVVDGVVRCGLSESTVAAADCLECRLLTYVSDERAASRWCSTGEPDRQGRAAGGASDGL